MTETERLAAQLATALEGLLMEWDKLTRYGSPIAKAANERVTFARAVLAKARANSLPHHQKGKRNDER
jgi:hypothetical protein